MNHCHGLRSCQLSAALCSTLLVILICQASAYRHEERAHTVEFDLHTLTHDGTATHVNATNTSGGFKAMSLTSKLARSKLADFTGIGDITLRSVGDKIYVIHTGVFACILGVCLCCLVVQYGRKDGQDKNREIQDLMEAHRLNGRDVRAFWEDPLGRQDFTAARLRHAMPRVMLSLVFWLSGLYVNNVCQAWVQQNTADYYTSRWIPRSATKDHVMLWDIGFKIMPTQPYTNSFFCELFARGAPIFVVLRFCVFTGPLSMRWTILSRMFLLWGVLWALRAITIVATVLPNPDATCKARITYPENIFMEALANMPFVFWRNEITCHDVMFSGHTTILTLATLMWLHYSDWAPWPQFGTSWGGTLIFRILVIMNMLAGYYCIIASKFHYTTDVIVACILTALIFQAYHSAVRTAFLPSTKGALLRNGFDNFLAWFDEDAIDVTVQRTMLHRSIAQCSRSLI